MARRKNVLKLESSNLFLTIFKKDKSNFAIAISSDVAHAKGLNPPNFEKEAEEEKDDKEKQNHTEGFAELQKEIASAISAHRALDKVVAMLDVAKGDIQFIFNIAPALKQFASLVHQDDSRKVYSFDTRHAGEITKALRETRLGINGMEQLPRLLLVGLVSEYDIFLQKLIRLGLSVQKDVAAQIDRSLSLKDLKQFSTIQEASNYLIDREIDSILHDSHHDQLLSLGRLFNLKFDFQESCIKDFLEICERRNLFTHNAGVVNERYLKRCAEYKIDAGTLKVGDKLSVKQHYFNRAVSTMHEISTKLTQYTWRKLVPAEKEIADSELNNIAFELLKGDDCALAKELLDYGINRTGKGKDLIRRMMIVNYANSIKLCGDQKRAIQELEKHDWSATDVKFQISVAAVKGEVEAVTKLMKAAKRSGVSEADFRTWPVFRGIRNDKSFQDQFRSIYGSELIATPTVVQADEDKADVPEVELGAPPKAPKKAPTKPRSPTRH